MTHVNSRGRPAGRADAGLWLLHGPRRSDPSTVGGIGFVGEKRHGRRPDTNCPWPLSALLSKAGSDSPNSRAMAVASNLAATLALGPCRVHRPASIYAGGS